jgi:NAD(P)-dependent dehydrogenase (short-subunit alcohol dehydrogenase family)
MNYKQQDMVDQICMVTGANRGIGRATAQGLANLGATVILVCRDQIKGDQARNEIIEISKNLKIDLVIADLSRTQQIRKLADDFSTVYD